MAKQLKLKWDYPQTGFAGLKAEHDRLSIIVRNREVKAALKNKTFREETYWNGMDEALKKDAAGLGLTCQRLVTAQQLVKEGDKMRHCVAMYAYAVADARTYIFHVDLDADPESHKGYTVEVHWQEDMKSYALIQAQGDGNQYASKELTAKLEELIAKASERNRLLEASSKKPKKKKAA